MDNSIKSFFTFLISKDEKIVTKLVFTIILLSLVLILNNVFGFSYYYNSDKKINQTKEISLVLENDKISAETKESLENIRKEILSRENIFQHIYSFKLSENADKSKLLYLDSSKHSILNFISTSWYFILIIIMTLIHIIKEKEFDFAGLVFYLILVLALFGAGLAASFLTNFIPIIYSKMIWLNYIVNFIIIFIIFHKLIILDFQNLKNADSSI